MAIEVSTTNQDSSKIEVTKNSKGYTWVIRLTCKDGEEQNTIDRIEAINTDLTRRFKSE
jgi:hypothetical protein